MTGSTNDDRMPRGAAILTREQGSAWFCVMVAFLAFAAAIGSGGLAGALRDAALWDNRVFNRLTVQIMPEGLAPPPREIPAAIAVLKSTPGVISADVMTKSDNLALVAPWLGQSASLDTLPFPALIDVKLAPGASPNMADLRKRLVTSAPHAVVDEHRQLLNAIGPAPNHSVWMAALLLSVSGFAFVFVLLSAVRAQILVQRKNLELLQLLGATDWRVAQQWGAWPAIPVLLASFGGTALAAGLFLLRTFPERLGIPVATLIPAVASSDVLWLAFIPIAAAIMAWVTCRLLVMSVLRRA